MLTFDNPKTITVDRARVRSFTVYLADDPVIPGLTPPVVRTTVEQGSRANGAFVGNRTFTVTIIPPVAEQIISGTETIVRALLEYMQSENFLPSGTIEE